MHHCLEVVGLAAMAAELLVLVEVVLLAEIVVIAALLKNARAETAVADAVVKLVYIVREDVQVVMLVGLVEAVARAEGVVDGEVVEEIVDPAVGVQKNGDSETVMKDVDTVVAALEIAAAVKSDGALEKEY